MSAWFVKTNSGYDSFAGTIKFGIISLNMTIADILTYFYNLSR